ncbi:MAG: DnaJ domain-containing protein [Desulfobacterales bacterium]|nr:DnaJ domain-containing protein [Desulfobacterales bacterium]
MKLLLTVLALIYAVFPRDLLPDYLPGWGWIDDLVIFYLLWKYYYAPAAKRRKGFQQEARRPDSGGNANEQPPEANPYRVLGIGLDATPEQIRQAYRTLAAQYHPDKVAHLGEEFRTLAEKRFKEIQEAYEKIKQ